MSTDCVVFFFKQALVALVRLTRAAIYRTLSALSFRLVEVHVRRVSMLATAKRESGTRRPKAEERIDARLPTATKQLIERAAVIIGVTTSDFIISKAYEAATAVVREYDTWTLNRRDSRSFVDALLTPPEPNEALKAAAARYKLRR